MAVVGHWRGLSHEGSGRGRRAASRRARLDAPGALAAGPQRCAGDPWIGAPALAAYQADRTAAIAHDLPPCSRHAPPARRRSSASPSSRRRHRADPGRRAERRRRRSRSDVRSAGRAGASSPARPAPLAALHAQANQLLARRHSARSSSGSPQLQAATRSSSTSGPRGAGRAAPSSPSSSSVARRPRRRRSRSSASTRSDKRRRRPALPGQAARCRTRAYEDPRRAIARSLRRRRVLPDHRLLDRDGQARPTSTRAGTRRAAELEADIERYLGDDAREVRVDPLTGLRDDRRRRPRRPRPGARLRRASRRDPIDPETRPVPARATRTDAARASTPCARTAARRTRRAGPCASSPNLYPGADRRRRTSPSRDANPDLFTAARRRRRPRGDRQRARSRSTSLADLDRRAGRGGRRRLARAHARPRATPRSCT